MDPLTDLLSVAGVRGVAGAQVEAGGDWVSQQGHITGAAFHAITSGTAWLGLDEEEPRELVAGDVVLIASGTRHRLGSDREAVLSTCDHSGEWTRPGVVSIGSGPVRTHILCASFDHDPAVSTQLLALLPPVVHLHGAGCLAGSLGLLARELEHPLLGSAVVLDRMVDILLVQFLRSWLETAPEAAAPSWLGGLGDPVVGQALGLLHGDPARDWTTASLAHELAVSRATLSRRFPAALGQTPGAYLTRWRMDLAAVRLRDTDDPLEVIAGDVGYTSVHAFNRAFRRERAEPPGRFRAAARAALGAAQAA